MNACMYQHEECTGARRASLQRTLSVASRSAPWYTSRLTASMLPVITAWCSGVRKCSSTRFTVAPRRTSSSMTSIAFVQPTAQKIQVHPAGVHSPYEATTKKFATRQVQGGGKRRYQCKWRVVGTGSAAHIGCEIVDTGLPVVDHTEHLVEILTMRQMYEPDPLDRFAWPNDDLSSHVSVAPNPYHRRVCSCKPQRLIRQSILNIYVHACIYIYIL